MEQEVIIGENSIERTIAILTERNCQQVLFTAGQVLDPSLLQKLKKSFAGNMQVIYPSAGLPRMESILPYLNQLNKHPDAIVAIGGGRVLDIAKYLIYLLMQKRNELPFFIAIPSTAGSGSEATPFAAIYEGTLKKSFSAHQLLPRVVLLDHELLDTLPPGQRAVSGIDAVCHSIESIWNKYATGESVQYAAEALKILWKELPLFITATDVERRKKMQWAAYLSGKAIAITKTTGCHALSYYLTAVHGVAHGQAVALFLPAFFLYNQKDADEGKMNSIYEIMGVNNSEAACLASRRFILDCGLANTFSELNIQVQTDELLHSVNTERFDNNPSPFEHSRLRQLILSNII